MRYVLSLSGCHQWLTAFAYIRAQNNFMNFGPCLLCSRKRNNFVLRFMSFFSLFVVWFTLHHLKAISHSDMTTDMTEINIKKLHMLTATDLRTSKTAKNKKGILLYHCTSSYVNMQQYSKITVFFAVFDVRWSFAVNMRINCSFYINFCCFSVNEFAY